jgi:hypothetical protein
MSRDSPDGPRFGRNFPPFGAFDKAEPSPPGALERANWDDWSQRRRDECNIGHFDPFGGCRALYLPESAAARASEPSPRRWRAAMSALANEIGVCGIPLATMETAHADPDLPRLPATRNWQQYL